MGKIASQIIGPFRQILTMRGLSLRGGIKDEQLEIIADGGILIQGGRIVAVGGIENLLQSYRSLEPSFEPVQTPLVALPGMIDAHTHLCFAGSRAMDFAARNDGKTYLEIAKAGGGIWSTVTHTRAASLEMLVQLLEKRMSRLLDSGITTVEIKSGYGLNESQELKMLQAIKIAARQHPIEVIATCLAAHIIPKDFQGTERDYLNFIVEKLVPSIKEKGLAKRFDIFIEESAFSEEAAKAYLLRLKKEGFDLTVHGDQFSTGGSQVAIDCGARSVDHLEASGAKEIEALSKSAVIPVALPGASIGLGCAFTPARQLLDKGCSLAIASDWNPGSAPQGQLLSQAAILSTFEKLSAAEVWAGLTFRAASALGLTDRGKLLQGQWADIIAFPCSDYREILYHQGSLNVQRVWKKGKQVN